MNVLKIYNLLNPNGAKLQLRLGIVNSGDEFCGHKDTGLRWSFVGTKIPVPIRSGTWFNGFPENIMLEWLKSNGWSVCTCVNCITYNVTVYEPSQKGNESSSQKGNAPDVLIERELNHAMELLIEAKRPLGAERLYKHIHDCSYLEATKVVREMARNLTEATT